MRNGEKEEESWDRYISLEKGLETLQSHVSRCNAFFAFRGMLFQRVFFVQNKIVLSSKTMQNILKQNKVKQKLNKIK